MLFRRLNKIHLKFYGFLRMSPKASISRAMSILKEAEYIAIGEGGGILLTEKGLQKADEVFNRHKVIVGFLVKTLGVDADIADSNACRIEHIILSPLQSQILWRVQ